jgi:hypothetical protein
MKRILAALGVAALIGTGVAVAAASPASATGHQPGHQKTYTTVIWKVQGKPGSELQVPQNFVASQPGTDLNAFDGTVAASCDAYFQVDVYKDKDDRGHLLTETLPVHPGGILLPNHDGGFLAYDVLGTPYKVISGPVSQDTDPSAVCFTGPSQPEPKVTESSTDKTVCTVENGKPYVETTTVKTTTPYKYDASTKTWVLDTEHAVVGQPVVTKRDATDAECPPIVVPPKPVLVTPLPPTFHDVCGVKDDKFEVPANGNHVTYTVKDERKNGVGVVSVIATADAGYVLDEQGHTTLTSAHEFTNEKCASTPPSGEPSHEPTPPVTHTPEPTTAPTPTASETPKAVVPIVQNHTNTPKGTLAFTGAEGLGYGLSAAILMLLGGAVLMVRRRRKA